MNKSKKCVVCGTTFHKKDTNGSNARWEKQVTCSVECYKKYIAIDEGTKRLDPKTNKPFISGSSVRTKDGVKQVFYRYNMGRIIKRGEFRGYFKEEWKKA